MQTSPLNDLHEEAGATMMPYGEQCSMLAMYDTVELDYAVFRKGAALLDEPQRGLIRLTGKERLEYLQRMISNDTEHLKDGEGTRGLILNTKGRIMADMVFLNTESETLVDLDIHQAEEITAELDKYLFAEDVQVTNVTADYHRISLHGPAAAALIEAISGKEVYEMETWQHQLLWADDVALRVYREDEVGGLGLHLWIPKDHVLAIWQQLLKYGEEMGNVRPCGWLAYNLARLEGGTPLFHVDYGTDTLPHESGVLDIAVNFKKGCYRGQEIVARMESLGHPAKMLKAFDCQTDDIPLSGSPVFESEDASTKVIGNVTSSGFAPMKSQAGIGFVMLKWGYLEPGTQLYAQTDNGLAPITIRESMTVLD